MAQLYNRIMKFDKRIRFAALVDGNGRILEGGMREGVEPIEPLEKTPQLIAKLVAFEKAEDLALFEPSPFVEAIGNSCSTKSLDSASL